MAISRIRFFDHLFPSCPYCTILLMLLPPIQTLAVRAAIMNVATTRTQEKFVGLIFRLRAMLTQQKAWPEHVDAVLFLQLRSA